MVLMTEPESLPVEAARAGVAEAWDTLFRRFQLPLFSYVVGLVRDEQAALDIVQESFINATRHLGALREDKRFGAWLFGIAHQKCVQRWRRRPWTTVELEDPAAEEEREGENPRDWLIRKEQEERFLGCVEALSPPHRAVLMLHFLEDFSLEEIAGITGSGLGTVKSRMHYAKRALRRLLEELP